MPRHLPSRGFPRRAGILCASLASLALLALAGCGGGGGSSAPTTPIATSTPAPPTIASFTPSAATITAGQSATLTGDFTQGTGVVMPGSLPASSGTPVKVTPASTTQYTLVVTGSAGAVVQKSLTVTVVAPPQTPVITAPAAISPGATGLTGSVPAQAGSTYAWTITGGTITAGADTDQITFSAGASGSVQLGCVVTNAAGTASTQGSATSTIVTGPGITSFTAAHSTITAGTATTLTADFAGGTGSVDHGIGAVGDGAAVATGSLSATTTFTLTVTNSLGAQVSAQVTVTVVPLPTVTSFTASQPSVGSGGSLTLTASFTGGTGSISPGSVAVTSGSPATVSPSVSTNYVLTVTNAAGGSVTATTRVVAGSLASYVGQPSGIGNVTGTGAGARFFGPASAVFDAAGNVYVADKQNNVIRMIDPAGDVSILAGTLDVAGSADGPGLAASFNTPTGVAVDPTSGSPASRIYVADSLNNKIRLITVSGGVTVSTFAGDGSTGTTDGTSGSPLTAEFNGPGGLTVDSAGNVWVADTNSSTIRKITTAGVVSHYGVALTAGHQDSGSLPATFNHPNGVAVDGSGNAFVADTGNDTIRLISSGGVVSTYAGVWTGAPGNADTTASTPLGGFNTPTGVALDPSGNVYVADAGNQLVRVITPLGVTFDTYDPFVVTLVGHNTDSDYLDGLGGVEVEFSTTPAGGAYFDYPVSVALNTAGTSLVVSDFNNNAIRLVPVTGGSVPASSLDLMTSTLAGTAYWDGPYYLDSSSGSPRLNTPVGLAVDTAGDVYVADSGNNAIRLVSPTGAVSTFAGTRPSGSGVGTPPASGSTNGPATTLATFSSPGAVAVDTTTLATAGNVYVADTGNNAVRLISGGTVSTLATGLNTPLGIAVDNTTLGTAGTIYVADTFNNVIRAIPAGGGTMTTLAGSGAIGSANATGTLASFDLPYGVAVDNSALASAGTVYVADTYNNAIRKITTPGGVVSLLAGSGTPGFADGAGAAAMFNHPSQIAVDPGTGNVYVADTYNQAVRMIVPATGAVTTLVGVGQVGGTGTGILPAAFPASLPATLAFPFGIAVDPALTFGGGNPAGSLLVTVADAILASPF